MKQEFRSSGPTPQKIERPSCSTAKCKVSPRQNETGHHAQCWQSCRHTLTSCRVVPEKVRSTRMKKVCREKSKNPKTPCNAVNAVCLLCPQSWEPTPIDKPREQQRQLAVEKSKPEPETFSNAKHAICLVNPSNMSWPPKASISTTAIVNPKSRHRQRCKVCDIKMVWEFIVPKESLSR
jgi:hypothetical protein